MANVVHTMAPKAGGRTGAPGAYYCCSEDPWASSDGDGIEVVYHEEAFLQGGEWRCAACGVNTETTEGTFVIPLQDA